MELLELIIKAHARAHAAELAVQCNSPDAAWNELAELRKMLNLKHDSKAFITTNNTPEKKTQ